MFYFRENVRNISLKQDEQEFTFQVKVEPKPEEVIEEGLEKSILFNYLTHIPSKWPGHDSLVIATAILANVVCQLHIQKLS